MAEPKGPVVVTGATGFIAAHLIQQLLSRGYLVHGTVRSLAKKEKYSYLLALEGAEDRLKLFEADLNQPETFRECIQGAEYVLHVASPYHLTVTDPQRDLVDPAVNGTVGVLEICAATPTVKRVVITSSVAAITDSFSLNRPYTEEDWNNDSSLTRNPYYYSKVCAERAAYAFVESHDVNFDICTINPSVVLGPHLGGDVNESVATIQRLLNGQFPGIPNLSWTITDVREAAFAHVLAMENPAATGRFLCCHGPFHLREVAALLRSRYPTYAVPSSNLPDFAVKLAAHFENSGTRDYLQHNLGHVQNVDNSKSLQMLGLTYRSMEETVVDTAEDLIKHNHVQLQTSSCSMM